MKRNRVVYGIWNGRRWMTRPDGLPIHDKSPNVLQAYLHNVAEANVLPERLPIDILPIGPDGRPAEGEGVEFK